MFSYLPLPKTFAVPAAVCNRPSARPSGRLGRARLGGFEHRVNDLVVAGAAAKIPRQRVANLGLARMRVMVEQRLGRHQEARRADAALQARVLEELLLQRMQLGALREALDRFDLVALGFDPEHQA